MTQITEQLAQIAHQLEASAAAQADIIARLTTVEALSKKAVGVVEAWDAVKTGGAFLKWIGSVLAAISVGYAAIVTMLHLTPRGH